MKRATFDDAARASLIECVKETEKRTDAELVLVVRARSGNYRHADYLFGALLAFAGLLVLLFSPVTFREYWVPIDVVVLFALGTFISSRSNFVRRLLTTNRQRSEAVRTGAAAMFYEAGIANTKAEVGVLVYLSILERRLELIADRGVLTAVSALDWNQHLAQLHDAGRQADAVMLLDALQSLGALLAKDLPATGENPNELPDAPRFDL